MTKNVLSKSHISVVHSSGYGPLRRWENTHVYSDKISGANASRPQLNTMVKDIRAGKVERVVCFKLDRLCRGVTHLALMIVEIQNYRFP